MPKIQLCLNGVDQILAINQANIHGLIETLKVNPNHIIIEHNQNILDKTAYHTQIQDGDTIEIVHFVGGGSSIQTQVFDNRFSNNQANMDFDQELSQNFKTGHRFIRLYVQQNRGITFGYKQPLNQDLQNICHGKRPTGGGIVFHNPGDLVFTCIAALDDPLFPGKLKHKMQTFRDHFYNTLSQFDIIPHAPLTVSEENINFCNRYPNPYELYLDQHKILALSMRKFRTHFMVQGILHTQSNQSHFSDISQYSDYFSDGIPNWNASIEKEIRPLLCNIQ